jgi:hypothetical protein
MKTHSIRIFALFIGMLFLAPIDVHAAQRAVSRRSSSSR